MLHVDLNDDLAEFIDVTFASGDNVVVVVVGQRDVANDARLQTTLAELPQQVLFRRQQSMVTIEEDVELHSINRPSLGSTSERDRRKQSMVQSNSVDDKTLDNKGLEDEEYYERIVTSISTQPLEHFMASLDDECAESVADSDVSSDVSYSIVAGRGNQGYGAATATSSHVPPLSIKQLKRRKNPHPSFWGKLLRKQNGKRLGIGTEHSLRNHRR
ncbi:hypothetical protein DYB36_013880 [Aphanomyces astaci]|uniref:Uncharacterized protein n=1 Tax=Aphanomyces astaci TaxID=112090 RepID=A0A396ZXG4_APHAT|nr:hypothetical protein DYB36_013880 [Aphanomyces astaci]